MNVAYLHYHLNHGGVTRVIANQIRALVQTYPRPNPLRIGLLCGGQVDHWPAELDGATAGTELHVAAVPQLQYDAGRMSEPTKLADALRRQLSDFCFHPEATVLHVHNHSLGKNASLPGALRILAEDGYAMLLQIHDFAEDHRPRNFLHLLDAWHGDGDHVAERLYPQAEHVHYAVLNSRDYSLLRQAGIPAKRLHYLPNSVATEVDLPDQTQARRELLARFHVPLSGQLAVYPVRAIRRKNLGEALLWSALFPADLLLGITLPPVNPVARPCYERWKQLASDLSLQAYFELGGDRGLPVQEIMAAADLVLTTSVAEGFGMAFLESWMSDRVLAGRNLPDITGDFVAAGMRFDHLYNQLQIPVSLIGRTSVESMLRESYCSLVGAYRLPTPVSRVFDELLRERTHDNLVDFADLNEPCQERVVRMVAANPLLRQEILELNPILSRVLEMPSCERRNLIHVNKRVVQRSYNLAVSGTRLGHIYDMLIDQPRDGQVTGLGPDASLLPWFLTPHRFRPLKG